MMDVYTLILVVFWSIAGFWLIAGEHPRLHAYRVNAIFGISNRRGKIVIGVTLIAFCAALVWLWYIDPNAPVAVYWGPLKLSY